MAASLVSLPTFAVWLTRGLRLVIGFLLLVACGCRAEVPEKPDVVLRKDPEPEPRPGPKEGKWSLKVQAAAFSPDGSHVLLGYFPDPKDLVELKVWSVEKGA